MSAATITCNLAGSVTSRKTASPASAPKTAANLGVPTVQPFHWARPQSAAFASSSNAVEYHDSYAPGRQIFVRPDLVEAADDALAAFAKASRQRGGSSHDLQFRSALEQVSYENNRTLMALRESQLRNGQSRGILGRVARFLRK